uniref:Uncharacterized protein n=1 Tax=Arundo donax TaxID=35708 RepID=A0A0A9CCQ0_ARUDO
MRWLILSMSAFVLVRAPSLRVCDVSSMLLCRHSAMSTFVLIMRRTL